MGDGTSARVVKELKHSPEYEANIDKLHVAAGWNGERLYLPLEGGLTLTIGECDEIPCICGPNGESNYARKLAVVRFMTKHGLNTKDIMESLEQQVVSLEKSLAATKEELAVLKG
jgi:hypothetical protein